MQNQFYINRAILVLFALFILTSGHLCDHHQKQKIEFDDIAVVKTNSYQFNIKFQSAETFINKNAQNGTNFNGNFSVVILKNRQNQSFQYYSRQLSFQCPAIHRPRKIEQQIIQMQMIHRYKERLSGSDKNSQYPFKTIILSFPFMISEFVPAKNKQLTSYLNKSFESGQQLDLQNLLSTAPQMPIIIYKGKHHRFPNQEVLYMVRKQLRLLSKKDSQQIQALMEPYMQLQKVEVANQNQRTVPNKLYQIKPFKSQQKQDL